MWPPVIVGEASNTGEECKSASAAEMAFVSDWFLCPTVFGLGAPGEGASLGQQIHLQLQKQRETWR